MGCDVPVLYNCKGNRFSYSGTFGEVSSFELLVFNYSFTKTKKMKVSRVFNKIVAGLTVYSY